MPSIFDEKSASSFFKKFIELNRDRKGFSQRAVSTRLKWPVSYLPDLIRGRKPLSIQRAVQFARYFKLSPIDMEKLILLSLHDQKMIDSLENASLKNTKSQTRKNAPEDLDLLDAHLLLVLECIRWFKGQATAEGLSELLKPRGLTEKDILKSIKILMKKDLIQKENEHYKTTSKAILGDDFDSAANDAQMHKQFASMTMEYFNQAFGPAVYNSAFVHIERSRFEEIADRIVAFRNWLLEISAIDAQKEVHEDIRLFQLDLNLTPIVSKPIAQTWRRK
jgi:uncharacterized protein (TIGR02147 family)